MNPLRKTREVGEKVAVGVVAHVNALTVCIALLSVCLLGIVSILLTGRRYG
mgnify:CR=1 FL=1